MAEAPRAREAVLRGSRQQRREDMRAIAARGSIVRARAARRQQTAARREEEAQQASGECQRAAAQ